MANAAHWSLGFLFFFTTVTIAQADTQCFRVPLPSPDAMSAVVREAHRDSIIQSRWCYSNRKIDGEDYIWIFSGDDRTQRPERQALVKLDSQGNVAEVTHASLVAGKLSFHRLTGNALNPMSVPLTPQEARRVGSEVASDLSWEAFNAAEAGFQFFSTQDIHIEEFTVAEGQFDESIPASRIPWGGFWWNFGGANPPISSGPDAPLVKYDAFVHAETGASPGAADWETRNHSNSPVPWGGHCNGWAAASILYPEPARAVKDPRTGLVFQVSDQKGLLTESSFCVEYAFYGERNDGQGDLRDIHPDLFHEVLLYYIKGQKKAVAMDYEPIPDVDNHVITGYHFTITKVDPNLFHVNATLDMVKYDEQIRNDPHRADAYRLNYAYTLNTDNAGRVIGGKWDNQSSNPDFMWVPLAQANCQYENPQVDPVEVEKILKLPVALEGFEK